MIFLFNDFKLNTDNFTLVNKEELISVEPQVFDLIVYLITHRDKVTTRQQLFDELWGGRLVSDATLTNHIKMARIVLQDSGQKQTTIKTVHSRGYQFIAEIVEEVSSSKTGKESTHVAPKIQNISGLGNTIRKYGFSNKFIGLFFAIILLVIIIMGTLIDPGPVTDNNLKLDSQPSILVVPFSVSGNNTDKWKPFADQMTREVIRNLRKISGLRVLSASSSFTFKSNKTPSYIRQQLPNVLYVLDAVVSIGDNSKFLIIAELDDVQTGKLIWDHRYQSRMDSTNFFSIQSDIATSVSDSLKIAVDDDQRRVLGKIPTKNLAAYELYIQGKYQLALLTHDSLYRSIELFSEAITLDPAFKAPYIAKTDSYRMLMSYFEKPIDTLPNVIESVVEALSISPDSAEARSSLGLVYTLAWRWEDAWNMLNDARAYDPNLALTELGFALYYSGIGDIEGVHRSLNNATKLDPLNIEIADWGHWALAMVGETNQAIEWAKKQIKLHPKVGMIYSGASVSSSMAGDHKRAIALAKRGVELDTESSFALLVLAQAYGYANELNKARSLLDKAEQFSQYVCPYESAIVHLLLGDREKTFELLNQAVDFRSNCLVFIRNDSRLAPLRNEPDFALILTRVGLDERAYRKYAR